MKSIPHFIKGSETAIEIPKEGTMLMLLCGKDALTMYYKTVKLRDVTKILSICLACIRQKTFFPSKKNSGVGNLTLPFLCPNFASSIFNFCQHNKF